MVNEQEVKFVFVVFFQPMIVFKMVFRYYYWNLIKINNQFLPDNVNCILKINFIAEF